MDNKNNLDNLEKEIQNYKVMSTSINQINQINQIKTEPNYTREPFNDSNIRSTCKSKDCKDFSVDNFVKDLESNLDNFDNIHDSEGPMPANTNFKKELPKPKKIEKFVEINDKPLAPVEITWRERIYTILVEIKEPVIIIFLFILLNNSDLIRTIAKIPYYNRIPTMYPSLILRGLIMAIIIYLLRKQQ
jgi:hypothetical protein